jgi:hypothetical protein
LEGHLPPLYPPRTEYDLCYVVQRPSTHITLFTHWADISVSMSQCHCPATQGLYFMRHTRTSFVTSCRLA